MAKDKRTRRAPTGPERDTPTSQAEPAPQRLSNGQFAPGSSGCPGGRSLAITRFARLIRKETRDGAELVEHALAVLRGKWPDGKAVTVTVPAGKEADPFDLGPSFKDQADARQFLRECGWGKALPASDMVDPEELPQVPPQPADAATLLDQAQRVLAASLARIEAMQSEGLLAGPGEVAAVSEAAATLKLLAAETRELARAAPGSNMSDEALWKAVLSAVPVEQLAAAIAERKKGDGK